MTYYNDQPVWKEIQPYLPEQNRLTQDTLPNELFIEHDGFSLHIDHYTCQTPAGVVILLHGVGGNGRLLSFLALPLARAGYEVICPDLPLYGNTKAKGTVTYNDWITCAAYTAQRFRREGLPLFLFGLSAGGMLAYQVAADLPAVSGIVASCLLDQRDRYVLGEIASSKLLIAVSRPFLPLASKLIPRLQLPMKLLCDMKNIANDRSLVQTLLRDRRSSGARVPISFVYSMLNMPMPVEPEQFTACPMLLVHPGDDRWTAPQASRVFFDRLACDKEFVLINGGGHFPVEPEPLQELAACCVTFLNRHSQIGAKTAT